MLTLAGGTECPTVAQVVRQEPPEIIRAINEYMVLFDSTLGVYTGPPIDLTISPTVKPRFFRPRPVPISLKKQVEEEIGKLVEQGVFSPIEFSEWATPLVVVRKPNGGGQIVWRLPRNFKHSHTA